MKVDLTGPSVGIAPPRVMADFRRLLDHMERLRVAFRPQSLFAVKPCPGDQGVTSWQDEGLAETEDPRQERARYISRRYHVRFYLKGRPQAW